jgi:ribonuclease Z
MEFIGPVHTLSSWFLSLCHFSFPPLDPSLWRLVFSGDTRPCDALESLGRDCDVLVHEATFDDAHGAEAHKRGHTTVRDAAASGHRMRARCTILTHFSQRFPRVPALEEAASVGVAFDFMTVRASDMPHLHRLHAALRDIYPEAEDDVGDGGAVALGGAEGL